MALTATVTKKSVTYMNPNDYNITLNLLLKDGTTEVLNQDISFPFDKTDTVPKKTLEVISRMQAEIDKYKAAQVIFNSAALNTAVANVQGGLTI
jgi:hypothetical protein